MKLIEVINRLEKVKNKDIVLAWGFGGPHSFRGDYKHVAFEPMRNSVQNMLDDARYALNRTFEGWKGGEFTMNEESHVYIAKEGTSGGCWGFYDEEGALLLTRSLLEQMLMTGFMNSKQ